MALQKRCGETAQPAFLRQSPEILYLVILLLLPLVAVAQVSDDSFRKKERLHAKDELSFRSNAIFRGQTMLMESFLQSPTIRLEGDRC